MSKRLGLSPSTVLGSDISVPCIVNLMISDIALFFIQENHMAICVWPGTRSRPNTLPTTLIRAIKQQPKLTIFNNNYFISGLRNDLYDNVYGQQIGIELVLDALSSHLRNSRRSLTLSFHGDPGTGKSFVSKKILKHMFRQGKNTEYVHFFRGSIDFPLQHEVHKYKVNYRIRTVKNFIRVCVISLSAWLIELKTIPSTLLA